MAVKQAVAASAVLAFSAAVPANAQESTNSVNWILPGCRSAMSEGANPNLFFKAGSCNGIVRALVYALPDVCAPREVNGGQMVAVVVRYIDQYPARWHESFLKMADEALTKAWPCRR